MPAATPIPTCRELYEKYHSQGLEFIHIANEYQKKLEEKRQRLAEQANQAVAQEEVRKVLEQTAA